MAKRKISGKRNEFKIKNSQTMDMKYLLNKEGANNNFAEISKHLLGFDDDLVIDNGVENNFILKNKKFQAQSKGRHASICHQVTKMFQNMVLSSEDEEKQSESEKSDSSPGSQKGTKEVDNEEKTEKKRLKRKSTPKITEDCHLEIPKISQTQKSEKEVTKAVSKRKRYLGQKSSLLNAKNAYESSIDKEIEFIKTNFLPEKPKVNQGKRGSGVSDYLSVTINHVSKQNHYDSEDGDELDYVPTIEGNQFVNSPVKPTKEETKLLSDYSSTKDLALGNKVYSGASLSSTQSNSLSKPGSKFVNKFSELISALNAKILEETSECLSVVFPSIEIVLKLSKSMFSEFSQSNEKSEELEHHIKISSFDSRDFDKPQQNDSIIANKNISQKSTFTTGTDMIAAMNQLR